MRLSLSILVAATALTAAGAAAQPLARPVDPDKTSSARVVVAMHPVGRLPYDGVTLPLVSPDGRFYATQSGRTPSWETLLADRHQAPPMGVRVLVYQLDIDAPAGSPAAGAKPTPSLSPIKHVDPLPTDLLLGRAADDAGFLVESPRDTDPEGARWIGRVQWLTGRIDWLVNDHRVNAHAMLAPVGSRASLAFVRRSADARRFHLVVRGTGPGNTAVEIVRAPDTPDFSFAYPIFSADGRTIAVFAFPAEDPDAGPLQLLAFEITSAEDGGLNLRPRGRIELGRADGGLHAAFQCAAALQSPPTMPAQPVDVASVAAREMFASGVTVFSPRDGAMLWWQPRDNHVLKLAPGTFAAAPFQQSEFGFLLAGPAAAKSGGARRGSDQAAAGFELLYQGLRLSKDREPPEPSLGREVTVVASRSIPRATTRPGGVTVLLAAPRSGDPDGFEVILLAPAKIE